MVKPKKVVEKTEADFVLKAATELSLGKQLYDAVTKGSKADGINKVKALMMKEGIKATEATTDEAKKFYEATRAIIAKGSQIPNPDWVKY
jgi:hypothetical protein